VTLETLTTAGFAEKMKTPSHLVKMMDEENVLEAFGAGGEDGDIGRTLKSGKKISRGTQTYSMIDRLVVATNITAGAIEGLEKKIDLELDQVPTTPMGGTDQVLDVQVRNTCVLELYINM
jgi:hypothetical protein